MKRILALVLTIALLASSMLVLGSCGKDEAKTDWEKIEEQGYFVCGVTVYEPMNYFVEGDVEDGTWTGFDTDFAKAVAAKLGVDVKFRKIDWGSKYLELNSGSIDLIWNGYTFGNESDGKSRTEYVDFTHSYLKNVQVIVTKADRLAELDSKEDFVGLTAVCEAGSSGESVAKELVGEGNEKNVKTAGVASQQDALFKLNAGMADFAVVDYQIAKTQAGVNDLSALAINNAYKPEDEVYAIGARKGSDLTAKINKAIEELSADGTLQVLAVKYNLTNDLIPNIGK